MTQRGVRRSVNFRKNHVFPILTTYIDQNQLLVGTIRCRITRGIVWWHFRRKIWSESKVIPKKLNFTSIYSWIWRENDVFPDLRANERENQKSKENHIWQIERAFE